MNITLYTRPKSILTLGLALLLVVDPSLIFRWAQLSLGDGGLLLGRLLGLVYLGIGLDLWSIRANRDLTRRAAWTLASVDLAAVLVVSHHQLGGMMNALGWALAAIYLGSALGFTWCALQLGQRSRAALDARS